MFSLGAPAPKQPGAWIEPAAALMQLPLCRSLGAGRHLGDGLQDLRSDLVGVALRVRTAVFQIALVTVVDEAVGHTNRSPAIGHAVAELVPRRSLVLAGQTLLVVRTVH